MNPLTLISVISLAIKYGPAVVELVKDGIDAFEAAKTAAPDFKEHLDNLLLAAGVEAGNTAPIIRAAFGQITPDEAKNQFVGTGWGGSDGSSMFGG